MLAIWEYLQRPQQSSFWIPRTATIRHWPTHRSDNFSGCEVNCKYYTILHLFGGHASSSVGAGTESRRSNDDGIRKGMPLNGGDVSRLSVTSSVRTLRSSYEVTFMYDAKDDE